MLRHRITSCPSNHPSAGECFACAVFYMPIPVPSIEGGTTEQNKKPRKKTLKRVLCSDSISLTPLEILSYVFRSLVPTSIEGVGNSKRGAQ